MATEIFLRDTSKPLKSKLAEPPHPPRSTPGANPYSTTSNCTRSTDSSNPASFPSSPSFPLVFVPTSAFSSEFHPSYASTTSLANNYLLRTLGLVIPIVLTSHAVTLAILWWMLISQFSFALRLRSRLHFK